MIFCMGNVKFESMLYSNTVNLTSISLSNLLYSEVPKRVKKVQYIAQYNARISKKEERRKLLGEKNKQETKRHSRIQHRPEPVEIK